MPDEVVGRREHSEPLSEQDGFRGFASKHPSRCRERPEAGYRENDAVRVTRPLTGNDPYTGEPVAVPAGEVGAVIVGSPGSSSYDVEFILSGGTGERSAVLIVQAGDLEPYRESA